MSHDYAPFRNTPTFGSGSSLATPAIFSSAIPFLPSVNCFVQTVVAR